MARRLLGYETIVASSSGTTSSSDVDVPGLSVAVEVGSRSIFVEAKLAFAVGTNNVVGIVKVKEGSTQIDLNGHAHSTGLGLLYGPTVHLSAIVSPTPGLHTYKVAMKSNGSATVQVIATSGENAYIAVWEL